MRLHRIGEHEPSTSRNKSKECINGTTESECRRDSTDDELGIHANLHVGNEELGDRNHAV